MKKTIDISLAGILFHVEEDAYQKLKKYLQSIRQSISDTGDTDEIMHEIEARIAELLLQKQSHPQQVINLKNIDEIIAVMGQPEDFEVNEDQNEKHPKKLKKALFRDMDKSVLGGVAAGLAHYIGIDITIMRLLFIILLFVTHGSFILIYLLLWIVIPKAKTASDKLKMKGESVNVDTIMEQVANEEEMPKKKVKIGETVENTTGEAGKIIVKILGLIIAFISGAILLGLIISIISLTPFSHMNLMMEDHLTGNMQVSFAWINVLLGITLGIPFMFLFLLGIKMLFPNTKSLPKNMLIVGGTLWFLSLIYLSAKASPWINTSRNIKIIDKKTAWYNPRDTLYIEMKNLIPDEIDNRITDNRIYLRFQASSDSLFHLHVLKTAEGKSRYYAKRNARKIDYIYKNDSLHNRLIFARKMSYPATRIFNDRNIYIDIFLPSDKWVALDSLAAYRVKKAPCRFPKFIKHEAEKLKCVETYPETSRNELIKIHGKNLKIEANSNNLNIEAGENDKARIQVNEKGIKIEAQEENGKKTAVKIDKNGIKITNKNEK